MRKERQKIQGLGEVFGWIFVNAAAERTQTNIVQAAVFNPNLILYKPQKKKSYICN